MADSTKGVIAIPKPADVNAKSRRKMGFRFQRRYLVAIMAFLGFFNVYSLRVNLSMAIVAMTANRTETVNGTTTYVQEFTWNSKEQGLVLGSFFYGYIVTQIPGGWLAPRLGASRLYCLGIFATALLTIFTPLIATTGLIPLVATRIIEGLFEGVTFPAMHSLWSNWAPPLERSILVATAYSGSYFGTVISMVACGVLAENYGWPSIFYVFGGIAIVWCIAWIILIKDSPQEDPYVSQEELDYIVTSIGSGRPVTHLKPPWKSILTSMPVWSTVVAHFTENWGFYTMLTQLPTFLSDTSNLKLDKTGFLSALPYLCMAIIVMLGGQIADWLQKRWKVTTTAVRKFFTCTAFLGQGAFLLATAYATSLSSAVTFLCLAVGFGGCAISGYSVNQLDIAPQYASILLGLSNTVATLPGIISPSVTGAIVLTKSASEWHIVFYIAAALYIAGAIFYIIFASGDRQSWSPPLNPATSGQITPSDSMAFHTSTEAIYGTMVKEP
uniref:Sialin n=1 Tax=Lynceus sp. MCZ IZ 141354 TaxID=1930659 RepID=A0A9N6ZEJ2_9CRUS|nr:EOG090X04X8 [Lynceus sp. MCZ IZ 141354]